MRIVSGRHRGRPLKAPRGDATRPTSDRTREAVFNVLAHGLGNGLESDSDDGDLVTGAKVLDVFAGAGALGLEALSRGAAGVTFIERGNEAARAIQANAAVLGELDAVTILKLDATRLPPPARTAHTPATLVFLDPPYDKGMVAPALMGLAQKGWLAPGAVLVVETGAKEEVPTPPKFTSLDERTYGAAKITFLKYAGPH